MAQIKRLADNTLITVDSTPVWIAGIWECGNIRFVDPGKSLFANASYQMMTPVTFHDAFNITERIAIKSSTDPIVMEFWKTFELAANTTGQMIDPNGAAIIGGLAYLAGQTVAPQPVIAAVILASPARIAQIQAGLPGGF